MLRGVAERMGQLTWDLQAEKGPSIKTAGDSHRETEQPSRGPGGVIEVSSGCCPPSTPPTEVRGRGLLRGQ